MFVSVTCGSHTSAYNSKVLITVNHAIDTDSVSTIVGRYNLKYLRQVSFNNEFILYCLYLCKYYVHALEVKIKW